MPKYKTCTENFLSSLDKNNKKFAFKLSVKLLESSRIKDKVKEKAKYVIQNIYNLNVGTYILKKGTLIGHGQEGLTIDNSSPSWYHPICYHPNLDKMDKLENKYERHIEETGYFVNNPFYIHGNYFIGYPSRPLKLLPFSNDGICMNLNNVNSKCFLSVNPQPDKRVSILEEDLLHFLNKIKIPVLAYGSTYYTMDNQPSCGFSSPSECVINAEKMYPQYDGMTNGCEIVIFPKTMKYISYDLTSEQKKEIEKVTGYKWKTNPMCYDNDKTKYRLYALKSCK